MRLLRREWRRVAGWILTTAVAAPLAAGAGTAVAWALRPHVGMAAGTTACWATAGLCLGLAQWLALRGGLVPGVRVWWALALAAGAAAGHAGAAALAGLIFRVLARAGQVTAAEAPGLRATIDAHGLTQAVVFGGLLAGVLQWRQLRFAVPSAANAGVWVVGLTVGLAAAQAIALTASVGVAVALSDPAYFHVRTGVGMVAGWAVAGPVLGLLTGAGLRFALEPKEETAIVERRPGVGFALCWLAVSAAASTIGMVLQGIAAGLGIFAAALIGSVAQWSLLRRHVPRASLWVVATVGGALVGMFIAAYAGVGVYLASGRSSIVAETAGWLIHMLTVATAIGLAQWLVLRRSVGRAAWWVLVWPFAESLTLALQPFAVLMTRLIVTADQSPAGRALLGVALSAPLVGLVEGTVGAFAITLLLRRGTRTSPPAAERVALAASGDGEPGPVAPAPE